MIIPFEKWHGCRNDFVVVRVTETQGDLVFDAIKRRAPALCDRRSGIGADGVLVLHAKDAADLEPGRLSIINSDGSLAANCGNGLRCATLSVRRRMLKAKSIELVPEAIELEVEGRRMVCRTLPVAKGDFPLVAVDMGAPTVNEDVPWHAEGQKAARAAAEKIGKPALATDVGTCEIGNPHVILTVDKATREDMLAIGPVLQNEGPWDGVNVHLVHATEPTADDKRRAGNELGQPVAEVYTAWVYERGAGPTEACGSGACAIGACAMAGGFIETGAWVAVDMPGGRLYVQNDGPGEPCILAGPAQLVYEGEVEI